MARGPRDLLRSFERVTTVDGWEIAVVGATMAEVAADPGIIADRRRCRFVTPPRWDEWYADPFGIAHDGASSVIYERFSVAEPMGRLEALTLHPDGVEFHGPVLPLDVHASYPFVVEHEGATFCVPETTAAGRVELFRAERVPDRWVSETVLLAEFPGIDSTVFHHEDRWWMLSVAPVDRGYSELHAFWAPALTGPWRAHTANPVRRDRAGSRPAGPPFIDCQGRLVRPAQDCSERYGRQIIINEIVRLDEHGFEERSIGALPDPFPPGFGLCHTLAPLGEDRCVIDLGRVQSLFRHPSIARYKAKVKFG